MRSADPESVKARMRKGFKVVQCTSVHGALDPRIFHRQCRALVDAGYDVVLIAPYGRDELADRTVVEGVRVRTFWPAKSRLGRMTGDVLQVYRAALEEDACIYHLHDPELIPAGLMLKLHGKRVLYDVHEDLPLTLHEKGWIPRRVRPAVELGARFIGWVAGKSVDAIVAATPSIARTFPLRKTIAVQNFPLEDLSAVRGVPHWQRPATILYVGVVSDVRGMWELLDSMLLLPASLHAKLSIAGRFEPPELEAELRQHPAWPTVQLHGWQSREGVGRLMSQSRVGAVVLRPNANFLESQPLKLFEYMAAGLPIVASDFPFWRELIGECRCGYLVNPLRPCEIAAAIQKLLEDPATAQEMGERGRAAVASRFAWEHEAEKLVALYDQLAAVA